MISFRGVGKSFANGTQALRDVSFDVKDGEFVSLLGPSGCGKSTALRIAAGLLTADAGSVTRNTADIGFVFQEPTLMPWADALTNARLPLDLKRAPDANARAAAALVGRRAVHDDLRHVIRVVTRDDAPQRRKPDLGHFITPLMPPDRGLSSLTNTFAGGGVCRPTAREGCV